MNVMFHDIYEGKDKQLAKGMLKEAGFFETLYADDTLLVSKDIKTLETILHLIEEESKYYNLSLNKGKCNAITLNHTDPIKFQNNTPLKNVESAEYLGGILHKNIAPLKVVQHRISLTMPVLKQLDILWRKANCSIGWKLLVYQAVITSKVLYGLETIQLIDSVAAKLDVFQLKGLRKILE
jgi:hypothetical protein